MTVMKTRPRWEMGWLPVNSLLREMNRLPKSNGNGHADEEVAAPVFHGGLWEDEKNVYYEFDMPGFCHDTLDLSIEEGVLYIRGERKIPEGHGKCWRDERYYGKFERTVKLPESLDFESIDASYIDGVLHLSFAKRPESMPTKIEIRHGSAVSK